MRSISLSLPAIALRIISVATALLSLMLAGTVTANTTAERRYLPDQQAFYLYQAFQARTASERLRIGHIGVISERQDDTWVVSAVLQGYPGHELGLRRGDRLLSVENEAFHPLWSFNERDDDLARCRTARNLQLRYARNDTVQEQAIRPVCENLFDSYRSATEHSVNTFITGNKSVSYLQLWALSRNADDRLYFLQLLKGLSNNDALILDLRHAYGYFDWPQVQPFFPGTSRHLDVSSTGDHSSRVIQPAPASIVTTGELFEKPLVVIANEQTRGGAELLLAQLSRSPRSLTTGLPTAGFIEGIPLVPAPAALIYRSQGRIEIDGHRPEINGIAVDFEQEYPLDSSRATDPQFEAALNLLLNVL